MFRRMRRYRQQISEEECISIIKSQPGGVLSEETGYIENTGSYESY